jgi:carboxymethylenebutenolidase
LRRFYTEDFISQMPADTSIQLVARTLGEDQLVDEIIFSF